MIDRKPISFNYYRKSYIDGSITPLCRGILHMIISILIGLFSVIYFWQIGIFKLFVMTLILSSYLLSTILHCIRLPEKLEIIINIIDHIAIHHHIFACIIIFITKELLFIILCIIFILNYYFDALYAYRIGYYYLFTTRHLLHYAVSMLIALVNVINYIKYISNHFLISLIFVGYGLYISGQIVYVISKNNTENKIWSYHETYHLFVIGGTIITFYVIFNID